MTPTVANVAAYTRYCGQMSSSARACSLADDCAESRAGKCSWSTSIVMAIAKTPSLNDSKRALPIVEAGSLMNGLWVRVRTRRMPNTTVGDSVCSGDRAPEFDDESRSIHSGWSVHRPATIGMRPRDGTDEDASHH